MSILENNRKGYGKKNLKTNIFFVLYMNIDNIVKIFQIYIVIKSKLKYYKKTKNTYEKYLAGLFNGGGKDAKKSIFLFI